MKNFDYYITPKDVKFYTSVDEKALLVARRIEINEELLTAKDRITKLQFAESCVAGEIERLNHAYYISRQELWNEFWIDVRKFMKYPELLSRNGTQILEKDAVENAPTFDIEAIFNNVRTLTSFAQMVSKNLRPTQDNVELLQVFVDSHVSNIPFPEFPKCLH